MASVVRYVLGTDLATLPDPEPNPPGDYFPGWRTWLGTTGADAMVMSGEMDALYGGKGADTLVSDSTTSDTDTHYLVAGDDDDADVMTAGLGNDILIGYYSQTDIADSDQFIGGSGDNQFIIVDPSAQLPGGIPDVLMELTGASDAFAYDGIVAGGVMSGGDGHDTLDYRYVNGPVSLALSSSLMTGIESIIGSQFSDTFYVAGPDDQLAVIDAGDDTGASDLLDLSALAVVAGAGSLELDLGAGDLGGVGWTLEPTGFERFTGSAYGDTISAGGSFTAVNGGFGNDLMFTNGTTAEVCGGLRLSDAEALADAFNLDVAGLHALPDDDIIVDDDVDPTTFVFSKHGGNDVLFISDYFVGEIVFDDLLLSDLIITVEGVDVYGTDNEYTVNTFGFEVESTGASLTLPKFTNVYHAAGGDVGTADYLNDSASSPSASPTAASLGPAMCSPPAT